MRTPLFVTRTGVQVCALFLLWVLWLAVGAAVSPTYRRQPCKRPSDFRSDRCEWHHPCRLFRLHCRFRVCVAPRFDAHRLAHRRTAAAFPSDSFPSSSPYGSPSDSNDNPTFGFSSGSAYGSPYGRRDGLLTLDDIAEVCRETQAIAGLAFVNWLLRTRPRPRALGVAQR
jgi:hypothetical protein